MEYTLSGTWCFNENIDLTTMPDCHINHVAASTYIEHAYDECWIDFGSILLEDIGSKTAVTIAAFHTFTAYYDGAWHYGYIESSDYYVEGAFSTPSDPKYRTITFNGAETVTKEFYEWFTANATPVIGAVTISYNGSVIATIAKGQTAIIPCMGKLMNDDLLIMFGGTDGATPSTPFTLSTNTIEIEALPDSTTFYGRSQVILSGGSGNYTVSDESITAGGMVTTSLVDGVYTIDWALNLDEDGNGQNETIYNDRSNFYIYFSDGYSTQVLQIRTANLWCLTGDALITLADGSTKRIDELDINDKILALNPETGELCEDVITFIDNDQIKTHYHYHRFVFEDGTVINTVHRHRFYNIEEQQMSHLDLFYVGDHVYKQDGTTTRLISGEEIVEEVRHYTIFTRYQNYFVNGILSGNRFTPYMALGEIPKNEPKIDNMGVPVFADATGDISLLAGSK